VGRNLHLPSAYTTHQHQEQRRGRQHDQADTRPLTAPPVDLSFKKMRMRCPSLNSAVEETWERRQWSSGSPAQQQAGSWRHRCPFPSSVPVSAGRLLKATWHQAGAALGFPATGAMRGHVLGSQAMQLIH
jgi:hypothetical protein